MSVQAKPGLCSELTEQPGRCLVHLVNYRSDGPIEDISITLRLPSGRQVDTVTLISPEHENDFEVDFQEHPGTTTFHVAEVNTYEIAVVTMK